MDTPSRPAHTVMPTEPPDARAVLIQLYWAAVQAVAPGPALRAALDRLPLDVRTRRVWIIAIGKAASPMAAAAVEVLDTWRMAPAGGVIIAPRALPTPHPALESLEGDHPVPGARSLAAATTLAAVAARVKPEDEVWVLLSGGTTSLIAAPDGAVTRDELMALYELVLGSGLDIAEMNLIRKRFSRWGAGRLAVALAPARVRNFIVSDVIGDDVAAIGSGPCVGDPSTASEIHHLLERAGLWDRVPHSVRTHVLAAERDPALETPKPGTELLAGVEKEIVASNRVALDAIAAHARQLGYEPQILGTAVAGEAASVGERLATTLASYCAASARALPGRGGGPCLI
ncbi:MAG: DUF4147 domain-containing protein, partial [Gemmatimonadaceae bacterium]|nr:DUF4147 domain-containing protein [Gemmatimonadaceae bacterium]